ncbi:MAG TPA: heavy-metal-associated domain-containing protein [Herpetosiphonaceae bacterium]|nr:heavy-metal-associated domain-containing protein [Herpetosiphonaceae bacterium]
MLNTIQLKVPKLVVQPILASGCCAVMAEDLITDELTAIPGVQAVAVEPDPGLVSVTYDPDETDADALRNTLDSVGYPADEDVPVDAAG